MCFLFLLSIFAFSDKIYRPVIVPQPLDFKLNDGVFIIESDTYISYDSNFPNLSTLANYVQDWIYGATQYSLKVANIPMLVGIIFEQPPAGQEMKDEEYTLTITKEKVLIQSSSYNGFLYGFATFVQLLPEQIYNLNPEVECKLVESIECRKYDWEPNKGVEWFAPCVEVHDLPRFGHRGILLDTSRHFFSVDVIKRLLRFMAMLKINVFQIHLIDDPGNRFESLKFPGFQTIGSIRKSSPLPWHSNQDDNVQYGPYYYKQSELRDLVRYAQSLGITIVPEYELPGHSLGTLAPYYQYSCRQQPLEVAHRWGSAADVFCAGNDEAISFLEQVFEEIFDIFPSKLVHVGADEVNQARWKACDKCKARLASLNSTSFNALEGWMISHFSDYFQKHGRRLIGWGEIIKGKPSKDAIVMNWQGIQAAVEATKNGYNTIDSSNRHFYFNFKQFPGNDIYEYNNAEAFAPFWYTYQKDPYFNIDEDKRHLVLGVQAAAWSEFIWGDEPDLHYKLFPRTTALSEIGWSSAEHRDWYRFYSGYVRVVKKRLEYMGVMPAPLMLAHEIGFNSTMIKSDGTFNTITWNVTGSLNRDCSYDVAFIKTGGSETCDLVVKNVKVLVDGSEWASLPSEGKATFDADYSAFYRFNFTKTVGNNQKVELQADLSGTNGNDVSGTIAIYATEFKSPYPTP